MNNKTQNLCKLLLNRSSKVSVVLQVQFELIKMADSKFIQFPQNLHNFGAILLAVLLNCCYIWKNNNRLFLQITEYYIFINHIYRHGNFQGQF